MGNYRLKHLKNKWFSSTFSVPSPLLTLLPPSKLTAISPRSPPNFTTPTALTRIPPLTTTAYSSHTAQTKTQLRMRKSPRRAIPATRSKRILLPVTINTLVQPVPQPPTPSTSTSTPIPLVPLLPLAHPKNGLTASPPRFSSTPNHGVSTTSSSHHQLSPPVPLHSNMLPLPPPLPSSLNTDQSLPIDLMCLSLFNSFLIKNL